MNDTPVGLKEPDHWRDKIGTFGLNYRQLGQDQRRVLALLWEMHKELADGTAEIQNEE